MTSRSTIVFATMVAIATPVHASTGISAEPMQSPADAGGTAPAPAATMSYADMADLVVGSPLVIDATIRSATRIKGAEAAGVAAGRTRFYVEADVGTLVSGRAAIPARIGWLVDVAPDWRGRVPNLKKRRVLAFARPVSGSGGQVQLIAPDAQRDWTPGDAALARRIATEVTATDAPPVVVDVRNAFHVPGALPGEGETQIFLATKDNRPAALSILRRPGEEPRWSVALSEIIDDGAVAPQRDTLLWYRLACALPAALPDRSTAALSPEDATVARADYAYVIEQLGPCRAAATPAPAPVSGGDAPR
jgi:hypothetical protein